MSESIISVLIAIGIIIVLALFVPCTESLARLLRRRAQQRNDAAEQQSEQVCKRNVA